MIDSIETVELLSAARWLRASCYFYGGDPHWELHIRLVAPDVAAHRRPLERADPRNRSVRRA